MIRAQVSDLTASGDTTKTLIGTITLAATARRIIGVWCYGIAAAAMTTAETLTGFFELESSDVNIVPLQLPMALVSALTSGAVGFNPQIIPVDIAVKGQEKISGYVTKDMAETGSVKARWGIIYESE
jgi:hypothetical protein